MPPKGAMNRKPPIPLKTCSVSSLAPTSDRWPHGLILMSPPRCAPCSPARQDHNPHQALPEHCTHSYLRRNDDVVCHCSLLGDGLDEYLPNVYITDWYHTTYSFRKVPKSPHLFRHTTAPDGKQPSLSPVRRKRCSSFHPRLPVVHCGHRHLTHSAWRRLGCYSQFQRRKKT